MGWAFLSQSKMGSLGPSRPENEYRCSTALLGPPLSSLALKLSDNFCGFVSFPDNGPPHPKICSSFACGEGMMRNRVSRKQAEKFS